MAMRLKGLCVSDNALKNAIVGLTGGSDLGGRHHRFLYSRQSGRGRKWEAEARSARWPALGTGDSKAVLPGLIEFLADAIRACATEQRTRSGASATDAGPAVDALVGRLADEELESATDRRGLGSVVVWA